jgi:hypothetical protein
MPPLPGLNAAAQSTIVAWHSLIETRDIGKLAEITSDEFVFRSPAVFTPFAGKDAFLLIIGTVTDIFEDFRYHRQFSTPDGYSAVLEFEAGISGKSLKGIDMIRFDEDGLISEFEVMIRPANALMVLAERMGAAAGPGLAKMRAAEPARS